MAMCRIQDAAELDEFYDKPDPWGYYMNAEDTRRRNELMALLPSRKWRRTLDIGCGNGFLTLELPGDDVLGVDLSEAAIEWARKAAATRSDSARFRFEVRSIFDLKPPDAGGFDLVTITGVLYPQYIGRAASVVSLIVDRLLAPGGILVTCHIDEWNPPRFPYVQLDTALYPYRGHTHRLEVFLK